MTLSHYLSKNLGSPAYMNTMVTWPSGKMGLFSAQCAHSARCAPKGQLVALPHTNRAVLNTQQKMDSQYISTFVHAF